MELGNQSLKVLRASIGSTQAAGLEMGVNAMSMLAGTTSTELEQGRVLQLLNMVTAEELIDNEDYSGKCHLIRTLANLHKTDLGEQKSAKMLRKSVRGMARFLT